MKSWYWASLGRELRSSWKSLSLATLSLFLAITALTSVLLLDSRLSEQTQKQAELLLGGDLEIQDVRLLPESLLEKIQTSDKVRSHTRITTFITLMSSAGVERPRLVETLAIDEKFPLGSALKMSPQADYDQLKRGGVWVEKGLADALGLRPVASPVPMTLNEKALQSLLSDKRAMRIGKRIFPIVSLVENDQMRDFGSFAVGARIYMARESAQKNKFISAQSRIRDKFILQLAKSISATDGKKWLQGELETFSSGSLALKTKDDALRNAFKPARSLFLFYDAIGFAVLILLGLGCSQGIYSYLNRKKTDADILNRLGAPRTQTAALYIGNVVVLALAAFACGIWAGQHFCETFLVPRLSLWTPGQMAAATSGGPAAGLALRFGAAGLLLTTSLVLPGALVLLSNKKTLEIIDSGDKKYFPKFTSPLQKIATLAKNSPDFLWIFANFLLSFLISREVLLNSIIIVILTGIYFAVRGIVRAARRFGVGSPIKLPLFFRLATSEISSRPTQSALSLLLFCLSVCLIVFLLDLRLNIESQLTGGFNLKERPNIFVLDAPPESLKTVERILAKEQAVTVLNEKITRARLESINGKDYDSFIQQLDEKKDVKQRAKRLFNREQNLTSRLELSADENIIAGQFWSKSSAETNLAEVSVERGIADALGIQLGDKIIFNIQGVPVKVKVSSLRTVRWMNFRPNFLFVLHPSVLSDAPYSALVAAHIQDPKSKSQVLSRLFQELPGLTTIDASEFSAMANRLIQAALDIVRTLGWILFAGALINVGLTAWTSYSVRAQHFSLYRCLGANNAVVMSACVSEFLILCVVGVGLGLIASTLLSTLVAEFILTADDQLNNSLFPSVTVATTVLCIGTAAGCLTAAFILKQPPLKILRQPS